MSQAFAFGYTDALVHAGMVKDAQLAKRLWEAASQRPWQEGLVDVGDELAGLLPQFGRTADDAVEGVRRTTQQVRRSAPADPRMKTYGPRTRQ